MSRVTNAIKIRKRAQEARRQRWRRALYRSRRFRDHHQCSGRVCGWAPKKVRRAARRSPPGGKGES